MSQSAPFSDLTEAESRLAAAVAGFVPQLGLNRMSVEAGAKAAGMSAGERDLIAPNGAADIAALLWRSHDEVLTKPEMANTISNMKIRDKIGHLLNARIDAFARDEKLAQRMAGFFALPHHFDLHRRLMWETADIIWRLAGDKALDENHYSKRLIVSGILTTAAVTRLTRGAEAQSEQIRRNIEAVMEYEKFKAKLPSPTEHMLNLAASLGKLRFGHSETPADSAS